MFVEQTKGDNQAVCAAHVSDVIGACKALVGGDDQESDA
jgi:hypothetical protein